LRAVAKALSLESGQLNRMQPWYAATLVSSLLLARAGYSSLDGVDYQLAERARRDGKPIIGLETATQQFRHFAGLPLEAQRRYLAAVLDEQDEAAAVGSLAEAWRNGDLATFEAELAAGLAESPELFGAVVVQRNRDWLPRIEQMLADPERDYLVVAGTLHMIGPQGLVELLRGKGYKVTRR
jgi:uncharacterized protein YbaP (TraB family)